MVNRPPAVSVAIRAHRRRWLGEAIASVLAQSWRDLELVVYDDAGDLHDVAARTGDSRLRYIRAKGKLEASGRFNAAVTLCRGTYIGVLDDDDRYDPLFVERLVGALEEAPRAGAAFCQVLYDAGGVRFERPIPGPAGPQHDVARRVLSERFAVPSAMLMRRTALDAAEAFQPMPDGVAPDVFVNYRMAMTGWEHVLVDELLVVRREHADQVTNSSNGADYAIATLQRLKVDDREHDSVRRRSLAVRLIVRAAQHVLAGRRQEARADLRAASAAAPSADRLRHHLTGLAARSSLGPYAARLARAVRRLLITRRGWRGAAPPRRR